MSQITERRNIISINEIPAMSEIEASMVNLAELSTYRSIGMILPDLHSFCPEDIVSALKASGSEVKPVTSGTISSPGALRASFADQLACSSDLMLRGRQNSLQATKASIVVALNNIEFKLTEGPKHTQHLKEVLEASDMGTLSKKMRVAMEHLEADHSRVYVSNLARACAMASSNVGFKQITIKPVQGTLQVIAQNLEGRHLLSEITIDRKTQQVDCSTETVGIVDGSCNDIIRRFNDELKKMGIRIGAEKSTFTGGSCRLPYSKILDQVEKQKRQKRTLERTRRLNTHQKVKH